MTQHLCLRSAAGAHLAVVRLRQAGYHRLLQQHRDLDRFPACLISGQLQNGAWTSNENI